MGTQRVHLQCARELRGDGELQEGCSPAHQRAGHSCAAGPWLRAVGLRKGWPRAGSVSWFKGGLVSLELGEVRAGRVPRRQQQCLDPPRTKQAAESQATWCASLLPISQQACRLVLVTLQIKCPQSLPSVPKPPFRRLLTQCFPIKPLCPTERPAVCLPSPSPPAPGLPAPVPTIHRPCPMLGTDPAWERAHMRRRHVHVYRRRRRADMAFLLQGAGQCDQTNQEHNCTVWA